jgi:hypothetical protein
VIVVVDGKLGRLVRDERRRPVKDVSETTGRIRAGRVGSGSPSRRQSCRSRASSLPEFAYRKGMGGRGPKAGHAQSNEGSGLRGSAERGSPPLIRYPSSHAALERGKRRRRCDPPRDGVHGTHDNRKFDEIRQTRYVVVEIGVAPGVAVVVSA